MKADNLKALAFRRVRKPTTKRKKVAGSGMTGNSSMGYSSGEHSKRNCISIKEHNLIEDKSPKQRREPLSQSYSSELYEYLYVDGLVRKQNRIESMQARKLAKEQEEIAGCTFTPDIGNKGIRYHSLKRERSSSSRFALTKELSETNVFPDTTTMGGLLSKNAS